MPTVFRTAPDLDAPSSWGATSETPDSDDELWVSDQPDGSWQAGMKSGDLGLSVTAVELTPWQLPTSEEEELPDPEALFLQMQAGAREEELPDPEALFLQMQAGAREEELPDPEALFLQMQAGAREEELPDPEALFLQMQAGAREEELPDPEALFLQMRSGIGGEELPDPEADSEIVFPELHLLDDDEEPSWPASELPAPETLFQQLAASEEPSVFDFAAGGDREDFAFEAIPLHDTHNPDDANDDPFPLRLVRPVPLELPDPQELFSQLQAQEQAARDDDFEELSLPEEFEPEEKGGLFSRLKAKFSREKKSSPETVLPDPEELFRRLELEDDEPPAEPEKVVAGGGWIAPELLDSPASVPMGEPWSAPMEAPLPLDDVLDAFRAELEAEEKERLDADLLGDLSGPERFAETVSDLEFHAGTFFAAPAEPSSPAQPAPPTPPAARLPEKRFVAPVEEPELPAMLSRPEPVKSVPPPVSTVASEAWTAPVPSPSPETRPAAAPLYQAAPRPVKKKSGSTLVNPDKEDETVRVGASSGIGERLAKFRERKKAMSRHSLSVFTRQLAAMTKAGIPLHQSIAFCAESTPEAAPMLEDICAKIESGYSLSGALREYPETFDAVYTGLVHTGELSGRLNEITAKLADILEKEIQLRKRMISVVTYPSVLFGVSLLGTLGFIFFILPQITPLFMDLNVELPWPTKVLLSLRTVLLPISIGIVTTVFLAWLLKDKLIAYVCAKPDLERRLAYLPISIPILGPVYEKMVTARVLYSLATMLEVGVTMNQALARSEGTSGNAYISYRLARARMDLADGASVTECFQANRVFPDTALHLIAAGEESARLIDMFGFVAQHFDEDVEEAMNAAAGMLEPLIMVVMGVIVGFITIAAALPTVQILEKFG